MILLLRAAIKKQKQSIISVAILFTLITISVISSFSLNDNSKNYLRSEMNRLGFGDLTLWVSGTEDIESLEHDILAHSEVESLTRQNLIYAGYSVFGQRSDDEGQLILYEPEKFAYKFINDNMYGYKDISKIEAGDIYISPAMAANFKANIGDEVTFLLARDGKTKTFNIAGYFEDPFMGSSMIDMKSFLIGTDDYNEIVESLNESSEINVLGRIGAMVHLVEHEKNEEASSVLAGILQSDNKIGSSIEFIYSYSSIYGFMLILQNMASGFLIAFAVVLLIICGLIIGHSISNAMAEEYKDMAILKTVGWTSDKLRIIQISQYIIGIISGSIIGIVLSNILLKEISKGLVFSAGLLIPDDISLDKTVIFTVIILIIFTVFIYLKTRKIARIAPVSAIQENINSISIIKRNSKLKEKSLPLSLALRLMQTDIKRYIGIAMVAFLLMFLVLTIGKMDQWLGPNGEGLMNSFSVAEHDLGVEPNHNIDMSEIEEVIQRYTDIEDTYELAMQSVTVNQIEYTANVLDEPAWFHIIRGRSCENDNEILVTEYVAADLGVTIGDTVKVTGALGTAEYTVVGIYSCANEMGANIGMTKEGYEKIANINDYIWCRHYILADSSYNTEIMQELQSRFTMDIDVHTNSWSGLDSIVSTMKTLTLIMYLMVILIIAIVVIITSGKFFKSEQRDMAILKSIGMKDFTLRISFMLRFTITALAGIVAANIVSLFLGDYIINAVLKSFGISDFQQVLNGWDLYGKSLLLLILFTGIAYMYSYKIKKIDLVKLINE